MPGEQSIRTRLAHVGEPDPATGAVIPPIHPATTYRRDEAYRLTGDYVYARNGHPGAAALETALADLDGGAGALVFGSGMAALAALLETVPPGGRVCAQQVMYHGALDWLRRLADRGRIRLSLVEAGDLDSWEAALVEPADLVWVETPANPVWDIVDIGGVAELAHRRGARLAVDSTAAPPVTTRPIDLAADYVFHSASKYLNGHSDVLAGVLVARLVDDRWAEIESVRTRMGSVLAPFEAWLLQRGLRTLAVRFERQSANALAIARHLDGHHAIESVRYPGLEGHPGHRVAARQMTGGYGGMLSVLVAGGRAAALRVAGSLRLFAPATSLGGVESLVEHRATIQGPDDPVADNLLRLSVGIEDVDDLVADLEGALRIE